MDETFFLSWMKMGIRFNHSYSKLIATCFVLSNIIAIIKCNDARRNYRNGRRLTREMKVDAIIKDIRVGKKIISWNCNYYLTQRNHHWYKLKYEIIKQYTTFHSDIHNLEERFDELSSRFDSFYSFQKLLITQMGKMKTFQYSCTAL